MDGIVTKLLSVCLSVFYMQTWPALAMKKKERFMNCGACIALVDEIGWHVATADPKKKLDVGSFRIDPSGSQKTTQIPYKRSELHLTEIMEVVCRGMRNYVVYKDQSKKKRYWIRKTSRDGVEISKKNTMESDELKRMLKFKCETIMEEYEEEIIKIYHKTKDDTEAEKKICVEEAGLCREKDIDEWLMVQGMAIMDGMKEMQEEEHASNLPEDVKERVTEEEETYDEEAEQAAEEMLAKIQDEEEDSSESEDPVTEIPPIVDTDNKDEL